MRDMAAFGLGAALILGAVPASAQPPETPRYYGCSPRVYAYSQEAVAIPGTACHTPGGAVVRVTVPPRGPLYNVPPVRVIVPLPGGGF